MVTLAGVEPATCGLGISSPLRVFNYLQVYLVCAPHAKTAICAGMHDVCDCWRDTRETMARLSHCDTVFWLDLRFR
jgi:hypothetical protein